METLFDAKVSIKTHAAAMYSNWLIQRQWLFTYSRIPCTTTFDANKRAFL